MQYVHYKFLLLIFWYFSLQFAKCFCRLCFSSCWIVSEIRLFRSINFTYWRICNRFWHLIFLWCPWFNANIWLFVHWVCYCRCLIIRWCICENTFNRIIKFDIMRFNRRNCYKWFLFVHNCIKIDGCCRSLPIYIESRLETLLISRQRSMWCFRRLRRLWTDHLKWKTLRCLIVYFLLNEQYAI